MHNSISLHDVRPSEVRLSPSGDLIYSADRDGFVRVYDVHTGTLVNSWDVGQSLGGMDISPDGSFLVIVERNLSTTYRVDASTGEKTTFNYATSAWEGLLFDVAVLSDGTALFTQNFPGSGTVTLKVLDFDTGEYTPGPWINQSAVLTRDASGQHVLIGEPNSSGGPLDIYQTGTGIIATTGSAGYNWGIQAFSGSLVAQYIYNEGINIYNASLQRQVTLTTWNGGAVSDLVFSADGKYLYVLENDSNSIIKISTSDWDIKDTIPVGFGVGEWMGQVGATNGSRLIIDPELRYFSVITDSGLVLVANPDAPPIVGTSAAETVEGALFGDVISGLGGNDSIVGYNGDDTITGGAGVDLLSGGAGNDIFRDTAAGLSGDTITDFEVGDRIVISNANWAGFSFSLVGNTLTYTGGSLTLTGFTGQLRALAAEGGGVQLTVVEGVPIVAKSDFNGDGRSDVLWRHDSGLVTNWLGLESGGFAPNFPTAGSTVAVSWQIVGTGDFNGDSRVDILWRHTSGLITEWLGKADGGFADNFANASASADTSWHVVGTGDFNGDGKDDVLWRHDSGLVIDWLGSANGSFVSNNVSASNVATSWHMVGTGDFNGDGRSDILWRHDSGLITEWLGKENGGFADNFANAAANVATSWHVAGIGDFNGDGFEDILWQHSSGLVTNWLGLENGGFVPNNDNAMAKVAAGWEVAAIGDYNGDRIDDILWRHSSGALAEWLGTEYGSFVSGSASMPGATSQWHVQAPDILA